MRKEAVVMVSLVLVFAGLGAGYLAGNSTRATETSTLTSVSTSTLTSLQTPSQASSSSTAGSAIIQFHVPWAGGTYFLGASTSTGGGPALVANLTQVVVFDCASDAATTQGCTQVVNASLSSEYQVTIWYPYLESQAQGSPSWANCSYSSPHGGTDVPAYCISLGPNDFLVAVPAPGPV